MARCRVDTGNASSPLLLGGTHREVTAQTADAVPCLDLESRQGIVQHQKILAKPVLYPAPTRTWTSSYTSARHHSSFLCPISQQRFQTGQTLKALKGTRRKCKCFWHSWRAQWPDQGILATRFPGQEPAALYHNKGPHFGAALRWCYTEPMFSYLFRVRFVWCLAQMFCRKAPKISRNFALNLGSNFTQLELLSFTLIDPCLVPNLGLRVRRNLPALPPTRLT